MKWVDLAMVHLPDHFLRAILDGEDLRILKSSYKVMYPTVDLCQSGLSQVIKKYATVELAELQQNYLLLPDVLSKSEVS